MRTTRSYLDNLSSLNRVEPGIRSRYDLKGGANVGTPGLQVEDMGQGEAPSLSLCLSIYLSNLQHIVFPFREWNEKERFLKRSVFRFVNRNSFIIFDYVLRWVYEKYTTLW